MVLDRAARGPGPRAHTARSQEGPASQGPPTTHRVTTPAPCPMHCYTATAPPLGGLLQVGPQLAHFDLQAGTVPGRLVQHPAGVGQLRLVQCLDAAHLWGQWAEVKPSSPPTRCHSPVWAPQLGPPQPAQVTSPYQVTPVSWTHTQVSLLYPKGPRAVCIFKSIRDQKDREMPSAPIRMAITETTASVKRWGEAVTPMHGGGDWCHHHGRQVGSSSDGQAATTDPAMPSPSPAGHLPGRSNTHVHKTHAHAFTATSMLTAPKGKHPKGSSAGDGWTQ